MASTLKENLISGTIDQAEYDYQMRLLAKRMLNVQTVLPKEVSKEETTEARATDTNEASSGGPDENGNESENASVDETGSEDENKNEDENESQDENEEESDSGRLDPNEFNPHGPELYENGLFRIKGPYHFVEPRWFRMQYKFDDLRARYLDSDPTPSTVHEFDYNYFHFDEEDYEFLKRLDPVGEFYGAFRKPISSEVVLRNDDPDNLGADNLVAIRGQHVLSHTTRKAIYHLHKYDPTRWTPSTLGQKFRISRDHARGIILLEAAHERTIELNMNRSNDPVILNQ
jgi:hypothetical protein